MPVFGKKYRHFTDEELLERFSENQNSVLGELYRRYHVLTLGLALKYLKDKEEARDSVSEIFLKLRVELSRHEIKNFKSWFYVFSRNYCLEYIRKSKRKKQFEERYLAEKVETHYDHEVDAVLAKIRLLLPELKSGQKECVEKFYLEQKSYVEIARTLSISLKQVKSHIQNGKRNLLNNLRSENNPS
jgi:RNA polymerase sigma-70 factor (ECF subfamily)